MYKILEILAEGAEIEYNKVVREIDYTNSNKVVVRTADGQGHEASKVIVCVPLSILQAGDITFSPTLPQNKIRSIQSLGVAQMDKLILEFEEVFWDKEVDWFNHVSEVPGDWAQTLNIYKYFKRPILMMFNGEPNTYNFENLSDEEVLESGMKVIRNMYPGAPSPLSYVRTNWNKDPFAKGTFSYVAAGSTPQDCIEVTKPIGSCNSES